MFVFYPLATTVKEPKSEGARLLNTLVSVLPSSFAELQKIVSVLRQNRVLLEGNPNIFVSGLVALKQEGKFVCFAVLSGNKVDRIATLPTYRNKGYARKMLEWLQSLALLSRFPLYSPVERTIECLYHSAGWMRENVEEENKDGTVNWITERLPPGEYDGRKWITALLLRSSLVDSL